MKYAAYDAYSIYAVGDTPDAATAKAREDAKDEDAQFTTAPVTDSFAAWIEQHGWNGHNDSFAVEDGYLIDTTQRPHHQTHDSWRDR